MGLSQVGGYGIAGNFSGDIFLAVSAANQHVEMFKGPNIYHFQPPIEVNQATAMKSVSVDGVFRDDSEATAEEAILKSIVAGREGRMAVDRSFVEGILESTCPGMQSTKPRS
jgi:L-aminopeptidase/D-esterase-like protein